MKYIGATDTLLSDDSRSREGAWIEICKREGGRYDDASRSREGAWIEIERHFEGQRCSQVAPVRERGLK